MTPTDIEKLKELAEGAIKGGTGMVLAVDLLAALAALEAAQGEARTLRKLSVDTLHALSAKDAEIERLRERMAENFGKYLDERSNRTAAEAALKEAREGAGQKSPDDLRREADRLDELQRLQGLLRDAKRREGWR
jgi:hypothetical protein